MREVSLRVAVLLVGASLLWGCDGAASGVSLPYAGLRPDQGAFEHGR
jgi:hypothetical protein